MKINKDGVTVSSLSDSLADSLDVVKKIMADSEYSIKSESVIDNIITALSLMDVTMQNQILFLIKQMDPITAEDIFQDYLYERVGLYRIAASPTKFLVNVSGNEGLDVAEYSIIITNVNTKEEFTNTESFHIDNSGTACVEFQSVDIAPISVTSDDVFEITQAPLGLSGIDSTSISDIIIGNDEESDTEFRKRFFNINTSSGKCSRNDIINALSKYVDYIDYLSVDDVNSNETIPAGSLSIVAKLNDVSDMQFAKAILDNVIGGLNFIGNTTVLVPLSNGQNYEVKFQKAKIVLLDLRIEVRIKIGYYRNSVLNEARQNVIEYANTRIFGLKSVVFGSEFIIPMLNTDGIEAVVGINVKRNYNSEYRNSIEMAFDEIPEFSTNRIFFI